MYKLLTATKPQCTHLYRDNIRIYYIATGERLSKICCIKCLVYGWQKGSAQRRQWSPPPKSGIASFFWYLDKTVFVKCVLKKISTNYLHLFSYPFLCVGGESWLVFEGAVLSLSSSSPKNSLELALLHHIASLSWAPGEAGDAPS